jgi:hypothetical protein
MNNNDLLLKALLKKLGEDNIVGLLADTMQVVEKKEKPKHTAYVREMGNPEYKTPFTECDGHEIDPNLVIDALNDAANQMDYSNWHTDKFDRAAEAVIRYCEDHSIPIVFSRRNP